MNNACTIYKTADFIGKRWTLVILLEIYKGSDNWKRYSEIKKSIPGITPKILSLRLKELESEGMISKKVDKSVMPIKSEYSLTRRGVEFVKIIKSMKKWALEWKFKNKVCDGQDCRHCEF